MLTPTVAAIILAVISVLLLIVVPIFDGSKKFAQFVSLRYTLVAVALVMALGCVLDFSHLADNSRNIVLAGGLVLVGLFVVVRSLEKLKLGNKVINVEASKGDINVKASIQNRESASAPETDSASDSEKTDSAADETKTNGKHLVCESSSDVTDNK